MADPGGDGDGQGVHTQGSAVDGETRIMAVAVACAAGVSAVVRGSPRGGATVQPVPLSPSTIGTIHPGDPSRSHTLTTATYLKAPGRVLLPGLRTPITVVGGSTTVS